MARVIDAVIRLRDQFSATLRNVNGNLSQFQRQTSYAGRSMVSVGKDMERVGKNISTKVSLPIIGLGVAASEAATKFKHEMADIRKEVEARGLPESKVNSVMTEMSNKALKWSEDFGQSTESINEGLLTLVKDGYSADEAMSAMNTSLLTARGANEQLSTVVDQLGSSLEAYGMKTNNSAQTTKNMAHMADTFAYIANHTKASITSLGEAFSVAGSTANAMHQPMAQTAAAIGILESNGVDANTAATALKAGLVNLTKPTTKMQKALNQMGFSAFDSKGHMKDLASILNEVEKKTEGWTDQQKQAAIATIFGKESLSSWNILLHKGGGYLSDLANSANGATGEVQRLSDSMKNTEQNKFKELAQSVHALGIAFGEDILPSIIPIVGKLTDMAKSFANLDEGTKQAIIKFAMIAAAIGPPILILGKLTHGIGETILSFTKLSRSIASAGGILKYLATPGGMVIVVITAVALAAFLLIKYWGPISGFFKKVWDDIKGPIDIVKQKFQEFIGKVKDIKDKLLDLKDKAVKEVKKIFEDFTQTLKDHEGQIKTTTTVLGVIFGPALIKTGAQAVISGSQIVAHFIASIIKTGAQAVISAAKTTGSFIASIIKSGAEAVIAGAKITIGFIASLIKTAAQAAITGAAITVSLIGSLIAYAAQGWETVASISAQTLAWLAQKGVMLASAGVTGIMTAAQWALNAAMAANPITWVVLGIAALVLAVVGLYEAWVHNWGGIQDKTKAVIDEIKKVWQDLKDFLSHPIQGIINVAKRITGGESTGPTGHNALGTSYWGGGETWVGENGPEKIILPKGAQIKDHQSSISSNNRSVNLTINMNGPVIREESDIDKIADALVLKINAAAINMA
ncbi:phage-related minor tail protein [Desulfosporosinus acididurans]|uniref:Phage-related minor tail protein n=1 Tax=Desulfosporosinus acididurans TaxID=476652 RepID=A0A0J1FKM1_9FIRM|nr:phage tail tape measure protein [Desulfosporosinus acididurans]KLU64014.1 phage-related minor tail protein [Desulfosporosinus acididurans]